MPSWPATATQDRRPAISGPRWRTDCFRCGLGPLRGCCSPSRSLTASSANSRIRYPWLSLARNVLTARVPSCPRRGCPPGTPSYCRRPRPGLWKVRFVAGGPAPPAAAQVAGLLCASADLEGLPYALTPVAGCARLEEVLGDYSVVGQALSAIADSGSRRPEARAVARQWPPDAPGSVPQARTREDPDISAPASPFYASSRLVAALARPPAREVPGIRFVLRPDFDVTPETGVSPGAGWAGGITESDPAVPVGTVLDWNRVPAGELAVPRASLNRHTFVCGASGAGKSQTVRGLLEAATRAGIPWLVVEPAKGRIPADGRPAARHRGHPHPAGGTQRSAGRHQPDRARARPGRRPVPDANPCRPGPGLVPGRVRGRRAVSPGPGGGPDPVL